MLNNEPLFGDVTIRRSRLPLGAILLAVVLHLLIFSLPGGQKPATTHTLEIGMTAPSSIDVVDRWFEPGGAQRVVICDPDGNTYCGRQEAVDDLRPWLQMPMMLHPCGGAGKRSGQPGWRNN